ncbi:MAG: hypothetical protein ABIH28_00970 [archaeon]
MESEEFCKPCDSRSSGGRVCIGEDFYPRKEYCSVAIVRGIPAKIDCFTIHLEGGVVLRRDDSSLAQKALMACKDKAERFCLEISAFYSRPADPLNP